MSAIAEMPSWDLTVYFSGPNDPNLASAIAALSSELVGWEALLDDQTLSESKVAQLIQAQNTVEDSYEFLSSFLGCTIAADTRDAESQAKMSELDQIGVRVAKAASRTVRIVGNSNVDPNSDLLADHRFPIERMQTMSRHQMSDLEEELASELALTGSGAWDRLHGNYTSLITVPLDGEHMPMSRIRALAYESDRNVRERAYYAELDSWQSHQTTTAACINSIKGEVETLRTRRGWESALDIALFNANMDRESLEAMMTAAKESFPDFRRYLHAKNKLITGKSSGLAWFDLFAPVGGNPKKWEYAEACDFVADTFDKYSQKMGDFARRTYRENWHDVPSKLGKVDGAFCAGTRGDESRILLNFKPSFGSVATLAHELGHAYHNICLANRTALQKYTPMTLAETASIFCETLCRRAGLSGGSEDDQISILEMSLQGACQQVVDISSRYYFESDVFEKRSARELSAAELCDAMTESQDQTYGDGLDEKIRHPYMWAAKPHYYSTHSFYNFPYMFGLLFALGLYAEYANGNTDFLTAYDDLLSSTGMANATDLTKRFGIDIQSVDFWRSSLDVIRDDINRFEQLSNSNSS